MAARKKKSNCPACPGDGPCQVPSGELVGGAMEPAIATVEPGPAGPLSRKIGASAQLSPGELDVLRSFEANPRPLRRRQEFITEGRKYQNLLVIIEGISIRYRVLRNGTRQVVGVMLPGDFAGVPGCLFEGALYSVRTLTDSVVSPVSLSRVIELFDIQPRLAAKIFWSFTCDAAVVAERLIAIGRLSALERVAHFVIELLTRMQAVGLADERSFAIPLTQELIGDALGLSVPHVNRVLRQLRDEEILKIKEGLVIIKDVDALSELADFEHTYLKPVSISALLSELADADGTAGVDASGAHRRQRRIPSARGTIGDRPGHELAPRSLTNTGGGFVSWHVS